MKYIQKFRKNEPKALKVYRETTEKPSYSGYIDKDIETKEDKPLKKALGEEQGWICAYCNRDITTETLTVEHYITQTKHLNSPYSEQEHKENDLNYMNMLATCRDSQRDCSGFRGNLPLVVINPTQANCEKIVAYRKKVVDGKVVGYEIIPNQQQNASEIQYELDDILRLNTEQLCKARMRVIDTLTNKFRKQGKWNKSEMEEEIRYLNARNKKDSKGTKGFSQFCNIAIWYLQEKLQKSYYQHK